jgi:hypothetical protein
MRYQEILEATADQGAMEIISRTINSLINALDNFDFTVKAHGYDKAVRTISTALNESYSLDWYIKFLTTESENIKVTKSLIKLDTIRNTIKQKIKSGV